MMIASMSRSSWHEIIAFFIYFLIIMSVQTILYDMREKCYYIIYNYYSLSVILSLILLIFLDFLFGITFKNLRFQLLVNPSSFPWLTVYMTSRNSYFLTVRCQGSLMTKDSCLFLPLGLPSVIMMLLLIGAHTVPSSRLMSMTDDNKVLFHSCFLGDR